MVHPMFRPRRTSFTKAPDYSTRADVAAVVSGSKKTPTEADYKPASDDSKKRCHECANYGKPGEPEADCSKIVGIVKAEGVCDLFSQRDYTAGGTEIVIKVNANS